jgi:nucleotide-binding universal stress UspA family protein
MTDLVVGTDSVESSDPLGDYLAGAVGPEDTVYLVNSLPGGDASDADDVRAGERAIDALVDRLESVSVPVETHQFVRGNQPVEDLLTFAEEVDADEFVIGIRKHSPVGKVVFGSTAQNLLLAADRPVRCVPLVAPPRS